LPGPTRRKVSITDVLGLLAQHAAWRVTGSRGLGRAVVRALGSEDPTVRTMAGTLLARSGSRAEPLLEEALAARESLPMVLTLLADIGDEKCRPAMSELTWDPDDTVAGAARQALRVLDARHGTGDR
jgi:NAD(P)-dependent dehydrogenase (short-subunit alcohol dehydrogenase family)